MKCNGTTPVKIKSLNGIINFREERFLIEDKEIRYFELTNQFQENYISDRLKELSSYYSNRLSYKEVEGVVERVTGQKQLSDEKIQQIVVDKAVELSKAKEAEVKRLKVKQEFKMPPIKEKVDIYNSEEKEILIFDDGILVKGQKANREKRKGMPESDNNDNNLKDKTKRVNIDVIMLEKKEILSI